MRIASVGSAFPEHYYKQEVLTEALKQDWAGRLPMMSPILVPEMSPICFWKTYMK